MPITQINGREILDGSIANSKLTTNPLDRANHTGTQTTSTISNFAASTRTELVATLVAGSNVTLTPAGSGASQTLTVSVTVPASGLSYKGTWNASTNTPTLSDGTGTAGDYYIVSASGSTNLNGITDWAVGDWVLRSSTGVWQKVDNSDAVASVFGRTGVITAQAGDYNASQITFVPAGDISSNTVQDALVEIDSEMVKIAKYIKAIPFSGAQNGVNTAFVLSQIPVAADKLHVKLNGRELTEGAGADYTITGATVTFIGLIPLSTDKLQFTGIVI